MEMTVYGQTLFKMKNRKVERVSIKKDVIINDSLNAYAFDISEGGMYIYTQADFNPGKTFKKIKDILGGS
jgi:hypothetical protein